MTTYVRSDPAADGYHYLDAVLDILGPENAAKIISTDFKGPGHDLAGTIIDTGDMAGPDLFKWHFDKVDEYGFAGWWFWSYRDTPKSRTGIRDIHGVWKHDLLEVIRRRSGLP